MKKRYLIIFIFVLFFNASIVKADDLDWGISVPETVIENSGLEAPDTNLQHQDKSDKEEEKKKHPDVEDANVTIIGDKVEYASCKDLFGEKGGEDLLELLKTAVNITKISIPLLLVVLGIIDFAKAVFAGSEENMKKSQKKFIKRLIIGVCIFLVPSVIKIVLTIGNSIWGDIISSDFCGIL